MFDFNPYEGFKSLNNCEFPMFCIVLNGKEFNVSKIEALILSSRIQNLFKNDESIDSISIDIDVDEVFENKFNGGKYKEISREDFCRILWNSFDIILRSFQFMLSGRIDKDVNVNVLNLEELCCSKVILEKLGSRIIQANDGKYRNITRGNAVEILNFVGNKESIEFVASNLEYFDCSKIYPEMLGKVLQSSKLKVENEKKILEAVLCNIQNYGSKAGFLLGCVEIHMLHIKDRILYSKNVLNYISNTEAEMHGNDKNIEINDNNNNKIVIDRSIIDNLLKYVECAHIKDLSISDQSLMACSIPAKNIHVIQNLNNEYKGRIKTEAASNFNDRYLPENVLITHNDKLFYMSDHKQKSAWIQFKFPEEVCIRGLEIRPCGNEYNPKCLKIEAIIDNQPVIIASRFFPPEHVRTYSIETNYNIYTKTIRIEMGDGTYRGDSYKDALMISEVTFYGYSL